MRDWAVRLENVSKVYRRGSARYSSLRETIGRRRKLRPAARQAALDDVSFEVQRGESYALIGPNGAGKSTALKLVTRISQPTSGLVRTRGRVGALMEVGSGIHPELTGRENIWLYGSILGLGRRSIAARFDEIVEFAEIGEAIDRSVKYYSSGMQLRLGFSIASFLEPDIFVVDEALAVGDAGFQAKCVERMSSLVRSGVTLLFVSHNLPAIEGLCESGALLINGSVRDEGPVKSVLGSYLEWIDGSRAKEEAGPRGEGLIRLLSAKCFDATGAETYNFAPGDALTVKLHFECLEPVLRPQVNVGITDGRPGLLVQCSMLMDGEAPEKVSGQWECSLAITALPLRPRLYYIYCDIYDERAQGHIMSWIQAATFRISAPPNDGPLGVVGDFVAGPVIVPYKWEVRH